MVGDYQGHEHSEAIDNLGEGLNPKSLRLAGGCGRSSRLSCVVEVMGSLKLGLDDRGLFTSSVPREEAKYQTRPLGAPAVLTLGK